MQKIESPEPQRQRASRIECNKDSSCERKKQRQQRWSGGLLLLEMAIAMRIVAQAWRTRPPKHAWHAHALQGLLREVAAAVTAIVDDSAAFLRRGARS